METTNQNEFIALRTRVELLEMLIAQVLATNPRLATALDNLEPKFRHRVDAAPAEEQYVMIDTQAEVTALLAEMARASWPKPLA